MKHIIFVWNFIFNHKVSPVRNIPDIAIRHYILQALGFMWVLSFSVAIGSYTFLAVSVIGHVVLIAALAITVAILMAAAKKPNMFTSVFGRTKDGEHE